MTAQSQELMRLLKRAAMAQRNIEKTMVGLAQTMPSPEEVADDVDKMVSILMGSLEMMEEAANDYALATREAREYVASTLSDKGVDL